MVIAVVLLNGLLLALGVATQLGVWWDGFPPRRARIIPVLSIVGAFLVAPALVVLSLLLPARRVLKRRTELGRGSREGLLAAYCGMMVRRVALLGTAAFVLVVAYWLERVLPGKPLQLSLRLNIIPASLLLVLMAMQFPLPNSVERWINRYSFERS